MANSIIRSVQNTWQVVDTGGVSHDIALGFDTRTSNVAATINRSIQALPTTGGSIDLTALEGDHTLTSTILIDRPLRINWGHGSYTSTVTPAIRVNGSNITFVPAERGTNIVSASNGEIIEFVGNFESGNPGKAMVDLSRMQFSGGGGTAKLFDMSVVRSPVLVLQECHIILDYCSIREFTGACAVNTGTSHHYVHCAKTIWDNNYQNMVAGPATDTFLTDMKWTAAQGATDQFVIYGPTVVIRGGEALHGSWADTTVYSDILLYPQTTTVYGSNVKIQKIKFGAENENMNTQRSRIRCKYAGDVTHYSSNVEISGNWFYGSSPWRAVMSRTANVVTCTLYELNTNTPRPHGMTGGTVVVQVYGSADATFHTSTVTATASGTNTLTWTLAGANGSADGYLNPCSGQAIQLDNPVTNWDVHNNYFEGTGVAINDNYAVAVTDTGSDSAKRDNVGHSRFYNNFMHDPYNRAMKPFANGGNGWDYIDAGTHSGDLQSVGMRRWRREAPELRNRLKYTEAIAANSDVDGVGTIWIYQTGVTVTDGQADPFGGTLATKVVRDSTWDPTNSGHLCFGQQIDTTDLRSRVVIGLWLKKSGVTDVCYVTLLNNPLSYIDSIWRCDLTSDFQYFEFPVNNIATGSNHRFELYPASCADNVPGEFIFAFPMVCDYEGSSYMKATSAYFSESGTGTRFQKTVRLAQTPILEPALIALGGGAAPTLGTIGGSGPATAGQDSWLLFKDNSGNSFWVPVWK